LAGLERSHVRPGGRADIRRPFSMFDVRRISGIGAAPTGLRSARRLLRRAVRKRTSRSRRGRRAARRRRAGVSRPPCAGNDYASSEVAARVRRPPGRWRAGRRAVRVGSGDVASVAESRWPKRTDRVAPRVASSPPPTTRRARRREGAPSDAPLSPADSLVASPSDGLTIPQRYGALAVVPLGIAMSVLDATIVNLALPGIVRSLHAEASSAV